ncbi:hypothetical protein PENSPDRAFT_658856 [Peniophora sp. CONT]|nr:hypothetical protein PENSPDRAFT_658856 [Peniophora sp. CONT]
MNSSSFRNLVAEGPKASLLDAIDGGQERAVILPSLEAELQRSSVRLRRLQEYRNLLASPVYCLHPEILSNIFFLYAEGCGALFDLRWTRLLLVCRRWYDVAKDIQSLWSFLDVDANNNASMIYALKHQAERLDARDVRRIEAQRSRAGLWPLTINMRLFGTPHETKRVYTSKFWEPASLSSLNVVGEPSHVDTLVRSMAGLPHTSLKTLVLDSDSRHGTQLVEISASLDVLLRDNAPNLRHLSLSELHCDITPLRDLRTLCIKYTLDVSECFALQDIIAALSRCPRLEIFKIVLPMNSQPTNVEVRSPTSVPMSHLGTLFMESTVSMCADLFQALTHVPGSAKILVTAVHHEHDLSTTATSFPALIASMGHFRSSDTAPTVRSVAVTHRNTTFHGGIPRSRLGIVGQEWPLRGGFHEPYRWSFEYEDEEASYIGLETETPAGVENEVLVDILQSWPLSEATHLDLRFTQVSAGYLSVLLANLVATTTVIVNPNSTTVHALLVVLRAYLRDHGRRVIANIIFDASVLKRIHNLGDIWAETTQPSAHALARQNLMRTLMYCAEAAYAGMPLDTIEIINDPQAPQYGMVESDGGIDWSELYRDLRDGFVHEGFLHSGRRDLDGTMRDSFAVVDG